MAAGGDLDLSSETNTKTKTDPSAALHSPSGLSQRSLRRALYGGAATVFWFLSEIAGYSLVSLAAKAVLLLVIILFLWAKSASLLNRPLPPLPKLEISDELACKAADEARIWVNRVLSIARDIAIERDRKVFLQVILGLWLVSYIGSFCSFVTLAYISVILSLTIPALYEKYQDNIDEKLGVVHALVLKQYNNIVGSNAKQLNKEKKTQ